MHISRVKVQPGFSRVVSGSIAGDSGEQLHWNFTVDTLMRPEFIIPREIESKLITHVELSQRDDNLARAFGFQGADHTLDDGNGTVFADGAIAGSDFLPFAPVFESLTPELSAFVGDDVSGSFTGRMNSFADEGTDLEGIGLVVEDGKADDFSGEVVNDHGHPISERPALRQGEREPGSPEAVGSRDNG